MQNIQVLVEMLKTAPYRRSLGSGVDALEEYPCGPGKLPLRVHFIDEGAERVRERESDSAATPNDSFTFSSCSVS